MKKISSFLAVFILLCTFGARDSFAIDPPTQQARYIGFSSVQHDELTASWVNGNGTDRIVVISESAITGTPDDDYEYFDAGGDLGDASIETIASGQYVVALLSGSDNSITITGLTENTTYYIKVFEYAKNGSDIAYQNSNDSYNPATTTTPMEVGKPTILTANDITYYSAVIGWNDVSDMPNTADVDNHYMLNLRKSSVPDGDTGDYEYHRYQVGANQDGSNPQDWLVNNLEDGTTYSFQIKAKIENREGDWSAWKSFTTSTATIPTVEYITTTNEYLLQSDLQTSFTVKFDQTMNTNVTPALAFNPDVETDGKLSFDYGAWSSTDEANDTWTGYYDVSINNNDLYLNIDVTATAAENLAGQQNTSYTESDLFNIDAKAPTVTLTIFKKGAATNFIKDEDIITVTATFSEAMEASTPVVVTPSYSSSTFGTPNTLTFTRQSATVYKWIGNLAELNGTGLDEYIYLNDFTSGDDLAGNHTQDPTSGYTVYIDNTYPMLDAGNDASLSISSPGTDCEELQSLSTIEGSSYDAPDGQLDVVKFILVKDDGDGVMDASAPYFNGNTFVNSSYSAAHTPDTTDTEWIDANNVGLWDYTFPITLPEGEYILYVMSQDKAGNTSIRGLDFLPTATCNTERSRTFTIDKTAPTVVIDNPTESADSPTSDAATDITVFDGTITESNTVDNVEYYVYADDNGNGIFDNGEAIYNPATDAFAASASVSWNDADNFDNSNWDVNTEIGDIATAMDSYASSTVVDFVFGVRATDQAGNISGVVTETITVDNDAPSASLTYTGSPVLTEVNDGTSVTITAQFDEEMNNDVWIEDANGFLNGGSAVQMVRDGSDYTLFTYTSTTWTGNGNVDISFTAGTDLADNSVVGTPTSGGTALIIDNIEPESTILVPSDGSSISSITEISGTIDEANTIDEVDYHITNDGGTSYWDGSAFVVSSPIWNPVTTFSSSLATYSITGDLIDYIEDHDGTYTVTVRATDLAGNEESTPVSTFTYDGAPPTITIDEPDTDPKTYTAFPVFDGTANDALELTTVQVAIKKVEDGDGNTVNQFWNDVDGEFTATSTYWNDETAGALPHSGGTDYTWEFDDQTDFGNHNSGDIDGKYIIYARAIDGSGNISTTIPEKTFYIDATAPEVSSIERTDPSPTANPHLTNSTSLEFTVIFTEDVTGFTTDDLTYTGSSDVTAADATISGSGDTYTVTIDMTGNIDGTVGLEIDPSALAADKVEDLAGNDLGGSTVTSYQYDYDGTQPSIDGFVRSDPAPTADPHLTNDNTLEFTFTSTEDIVNVDATDFELKNDATDATAGNGSVTGVTGSGDSYTITVTMTDDETVYLEISSSNDIEDLYGNSFTFAGPLMAPPGTPSSVNSSDETTGSYDYDGTAPNVSSITRDVPSVRLTNADVVTWDVTFSEDIYNFDATDISITTTLPSGGSITDISPDPTSVNQQAYTVEFTPTDPNEDGTAFISINVSDIEDEAGNSLNGTASGSTQDYEFDNTAPEVTSIQRLGDGEDPDSSPSYTTTNVEVQYEVIFTEPVANVNMDDFAINQTLPTPPPTVVDILEIEPNTSGATYDDTWIVTMNFIGDATVSITLDPTDGAVDIVDEATNDLGGSALTSYKWKYDDTDPYLVNFTGYDPTISTNPQYTNQNPVTYRAQFNEPVVNVDDTDFGVTGPASITDETSISTGYIWELEVTFSSEGEVELELDPNDPDVDIEDISGNVLDPTKSSMVSPNYHYDNTAPVVHIDNSDAYVNSSSSGDITGEVEEANPLASYYSGTTNKDVEVQLYNGTDYWDGSSWVGSATWIDITGNVTDPGTSYDYDWTYDLPPAATPPTDGLEDGEEYTVSVRGTDAAGNTSTTATYTFTYDVTPPTISMDAIDPYVSFVPTAEGDVTEAVAMGTVEMTITNNGDYWTGTAWSSTPTWLSADVSGSAPSYTWEFTGTYPTLADGEEYTYTAKATDAAGNESSPFASETFTYDVTDPVVDITNTAEYVNTMPVITGVIDEIHPLASTSFEYSTDGGTTWSDISGSVSGSASTYTFSYATSGLTNGTTYTYYMRATDAAGNTHSDSYTFTYDNEDPIITIDAIDPELKTISTITGTISDNVLIDFATLEITNGTDTYNPSVVINSGTWSADVSGISFTEDTWDVTAEATDMAGNTGQDTDDFIYDVTAPAITIDAIASPRNTEPTITGTYTELNTLDEITVELSGPSSHSMTATIPSAGNWSADFSSVTLSDGTYTVTVYGTDEAGNVTDPVVTTTFDYDATAPTVTFDPSNGTTVNAGIQTVTFTITFSEEMNTGSVVYTFDADASLTYDTPVEIWSTSNDELTVDVNITGGNDNDAITLDLDAAEDLAGNSVAGLTLSSGEYVFDLTPPTVDDLYRSTPTVQYTNANSVTWEVEFSEDVYLGNGDIDLTETGDFASNAGTIVVSPSSGLNDTYTVTYTPADTDEDGEVSIDILQGVEDEFGNELASDYDGSSELFTIDNTAPEATDTDPVDGANDVDPFDPIVITFSEDMFDSSVDGDGSTGDLDGLTDGSMITVSGATDGTFSLYSVEWDNDGANTTVTITPDTDEYFPDDQQVTVTFASGELFDIAGNELVDGSTLLSGSFTFTTANVPDAVTGLTVKRKLQNLIHLEWINGSDAEGNIIWANDDPDANDDMDETDLNPSIPDRVYEDGTENADGEYYAMYKGAAESVLMTGFSSATKYRFRVYAYEDGGNTINQVEASIDVTTFNKEEDAFEIVAGVQTLSIGNIYPNPVRDEFSFNFDLNVATDVKVEIVNTLGSVVAVPVNNQYFGKGVHNVTVPVTNDNVVAGTYFLRVSANGQQVIRPLTVVR